MDKTLKAIIKNPYEKAKIVEIKDSLEQFKDIIGCSTVEFCIFPQERDIVMLIDDDGKYMQTQGNFVVPEFKDIIVGPCIFVGADDSGETIGLNDSQINKINKYLDDFELVDGDDLAFADLLIIHAVNKYNKKYEDSLC